MNIFDNSEIKHDINRIDTLLDCGIFNQPNNPLFQSAFIEVLICLRDLMYKTEKYGKRIDFDDDVIVRDKVTDATSLINFVRDAMCHLNSPNHFIESNNIKASFNVLIGKGCLLKMGDFERSSPYEDDVCFFFGSQRIFLNRHILRSFNEAKAVLLPILDL